MVVALKLLVYVAQITAWSRVALLEGPGAAEGEDDKEEEEEEGFDGRKHWKGRVLNFDALGECWLAEKDIGFIR